MEMWKLFLIFLFQTLGSASVMGNNGNENIHKSVYASTWLQAAASSHGLTRRLSTDRASSSSGNGSSSWKNTKQFELIDILSSRNVYTCGFGDRDLFFATNFLRSRHLFRHRQIHYQPLPNASTADIFVFYGLLPHCMAACANFTGLLIYIDGEAGRPLVASYLNNVTRLLHSAASTNTTTVAGIMTTRIGAPGTADRRLIYLGVSNISLPQSVTKIPCIIGSQTVEYSAATMKRLLSRDIANSIHKSKFLAYAASKCVPLREQVFDVLVELSVRLSLGEVSAYGSCHGSPSNLEHPHVHSLSNKSDPSISRKNYKKNGMLFRAYKYVLAMENDDVDYYMTEKIFYAYQAGAIPIYWGASSIVKSIFHPDTFIYVDPNNLKSAVDRISEIERNPALYQRILQTPVLLHGEETVKKYFAVGISPSSATDPAQHNSSLSNRIWASIIKLMNPLPVDVLKQDK